MAITTKATLKTAFMDWVARTDISATVQDEIIVLAERDIARNLRDKTIRAALTLDSNAVSLPAAAGELRSIRFDTSTRQYPLTLTTPGTLAHLRRSGSGVPHYYAVVENVVLLDVDPDTDYATEIIYFEALVPLDADGDTNTVLTANPDIYLFGCLKEVEPYLEHDERNPMWSAKYQKAIADENAARERAELGSAPVAPRLPIVFG